MHPVVDNQFLEMSCIVEQLCCNKSQRSVFKRSFITAITKIFTYAAHALFHPALKQGVSEVTSLETKPQNKNARVQALEKFSYFVLLPRMCKIISIFLCAPDEAKPK